MREYATRACREIPGSCRSFAAHAPAMTAHASVMAGLDPAIHRFQEMDCRIKSGNDAGDNFDDGIGREIPGSFRR